MASAKKMGRPTDNPKTLEVKARVDEETYNILTDYCERKNINRAQGVRDAVHKLKDDK